MSKGSVLVVDDDKDIVNVLTAILEEETYSVSQAYTGQEALQSISQSLPDLILMDYMLPDINGDAVAAKIREQIPQPIPMILISAAHNVDTIAKAAGFNSYIAKPFAIERLLNEISKQLTA